MKNKGFTLIELLAVIAVLGVILVLVVPKVKDVLNDSKGSSYKASATGLVKSLENYAMNKKSSLEVFDGCTYNFSNNTNDCVDFSFNGKLPDGGSISIDAFGYTYGNINFEDYHFVIDDSKVLFGYKDNNNTGAIYNFDYTGGEQEFIVPKSGYYKLETWGAQGGSIQNGATGGFGGYSTGIIRLNSSDKLYINVGGEGNKSCSGSSSGGCYGGYNGGGSSSYKNNEKFGSGGGATHIALQSGSLSSLSNFINDILIVSGGGGGSYTNFQGGSAGGYLGVSGYLKSGYVQAIGGSQDSGGNGYTAGDFGMSVGLSFGSLNGAGGGGGYYGGGSATATSGAGGSSYIGNPLLTNKIMYCFECSTSNSINTKTISTTCHSSEPMENCAKEKAGYARITYYGIGV